MHPQHVHMRTLLYHYIFSMFFFQRVNVIWNHTKGVGKGYGFVTFSSYSEAMFAITSMNGTIYQGRTLQVSIKSDAMSS